MKPNMNFYLGVKTIPDAANAIDKLSFMKVLDRKNLSVQTLIDRIKLQIGPASKDNDLSKGLMIYIGGKFTDEEIEEINKLAILADKDVVPMVTEFATRQTIALQNKGISATHIILGT